MEILRKTMLIVLVVIFTGTVNAQDNKELQDAFKQSYELEKSGDFTKAADKLKAVYDEASYEINLRLGWLNYNAGLFEESMAHYERALKLMPYSEEAKFGIVLPAAATGKWDFVVKQYESILQFSSGNTTALYRLGIIYYGQEKYTKAYEYFKKVVDLYPFGYDGLLMLAWTNLQLGKSREAKILFNKVLLYAPNDQSALEGLGLLK